MSETTGRIRHRGGFTFIEMVIAVLIIGIMAGVAAPSYFAAMDSFRVDAAAKRIAADLNLIRENSNSRSRYLVGEWITFTVSSNSYVMRNDPDIDRSSEEYKVDLDETPYPVELISVEFTNSNGFTSNRTVKYDMYGCAKSGMPPVVPDAVLTSGEIVLRSGSAERTVVISPVTGEASVQ